MRSALTGAHPLGPEMKMCAPVHSFFRGGYNLKKKKNMPFSKIKGHIKSSKDDRGMLLGKWHMGSSKSCPKKKVARGMGQVGACLQMWAFLRPSVAFKSPQLSPPQFPIGNGYEQANTGGVRVISGNHMVSFSSNDCVQVHTQCRREFFQLP